MPYYGIIEINVFFDDECEDEMEAKIEDFIGQIEARHPDLCSFHNGDVYVGVIVEDRTRIDEVLHTLTELGVEEV